MSHGDDAVEVTTSTPRPSGVVNSAFGQWLLVDGSRWFLAGGLTAGVFVVVFVLGWIGVISVTAADPATLFLSVFIGGNITLVTIVISINQLVLSREFGKPHALRQRDEGVRQLRADLKDVAAVDAIPPSPQEFLRVLVDTMEHHTDRIVEAAAEGDAEYRERVETFRRRVETNTRTFERAIESANFGSFELLTDMLNMNSAWLVENALALRADSGDGIPDEPFEAMDATIRIFNISRQYTKTLYLQKELAALSRLLLYIGFVALLSSSVAMLTYGAPIVESAPDVLVLAWVSFVTATAFAPIAFLLSYVLRLSTIVSFPPLRNSFITDG